MSLNEARKLLDNRDTKAALATYDKLKPEYANNPDFWLEYGLVAANASYITTAEQCVAASLKLKPNNHAAFYVMGMAKRKSGEYDEAEKWFKQAFKAKSSFDYGEQLANAYIASKNYITCLIFLDDLQKLARNAFETSKVILAQGTVLLATGKTKEALEVYERFLFKGKIRNFRIFRDYVSAKKITNQDLKLVQEYEELSKAATGAEYAESLFLGLAKAYEDLGDYKKSAAFFSKGKELLQKYRGYDRAQLTNTIAQCSKIFTPELIKSKQVATASDINPIFIVGLPRTGTTLLEQVLSTNKNTHACGELYTIMHIARKSKIEIKGRGYLTYPSNIAVLSKEFFETASNLYLANLKRLNPKAKFFVDKMPVNINYLGLINILLPKAKIIHLKRDLRDVALSIFCHEFQDSGMQFSNSFDDIIFFIEQYLIILNHWKKTIPDSFIDVKYSDLVGNFDKTTKSVFDYCGLEWSGNVQNFHQKEGAVNTASRSQVRQPLYSSSVEKWRNYEPYYEKYFSEISKLAEKYGYSW